MVEKIQHMFRIKREVEPGDLKDRLIAEIRELRWARRMWVAVIADEPDSRLVFRHGARIIAKHPPQ
ncbi:hypothetical protein [Fulvimarina sp. MAC3]|uniref:hypothetical protein n=1 Tax=Fulvimarina sp. MAC3 TaxID=3148887 RepID=UPI0031FC0A10